jgi:GEVED domain
MTRPGLPLFLVVCVLALPASGQYCTAGKTNACSGTLYEFIVNVTVGGINNATGCTVTPAYSDFTTSVTGANLVPGGANPITVTVGNYWTTDAVDLYADWDGNGLFTDPGELVTLPDPGGVPSGAGNNNNFVGTLTPPGTAVAPTRLRVSLRYGGTANPCPTTGTFYGEIEDYTIATYGGTIPCSLSFSSPLGPGSLQMDNTPCPSVAGADYMNAITLVAGAFPAGWFFGLDIPYPQLLNEFQTGYPFVGTLGPSGESTFFLPGGVPSGLQIWAVSAQFAPGFGPFLLARPPVTYTTP